MPLFDSYSYDGVSAGIWVIHIGPKSGGELVTLFDSHPYCPQSFSGGGLYSKGNGFLFLLLLLLLLLLLGPGLGLRRGLLLSGLPLVRKAELGLPLVHVIVGSCYWFVCADRSFRPESASGRVVGESCEGYGTIELVERNASGVLRTGLREI